MSQKRSTIQSKILTVICLGMVWGIVRALRRRADEWHGAPENAPYDIPVRTLAILSLAAFAADLNAIPAILRNKPLIDESVLDDLPGQTPSFPDSLALRLPAANRIESQRMSDQVLKYMVALPLILLSDKAIRRQAPSLAALYAWVHAATYTIYSYSPLGPAFNDKYRPVVYYPDVSREERAAGNNRNSLYSGHTGNAACAAFFMIKVYSDHHPELTESARRKLWLLASVPPLLVGSLRVGALKHFPTDIIVACIIGGICGVAIPGAYVTKR